MKHGKKEKHYVDTTMNESNTFWLKETEFVVMKQI